MSRKATKMKALMWKRTKRRLHQLFVITCLYYFFHHSLRISQGVTVLGVVRRQTSSTATKYPGRISKRRDISVLSSFGFLSLFVASHFLGLSPLLFSSSPRYLTRSPIVLTIYIHICLCISRYLYISAYVCIPIRGCAPRWNQPPIAFYVTANSLWARSSL